MTDSQDGAINVKLGQACHILQQFIIVYENFVEIKHIF